MKIYKKTMAIASSLMLLSLQSASAFAIDNNYGIVYSGGIELTTNGANKNVNALEDELVPVVNRTSEDYKMEFIDGGADKWKLGCLSDTYKMRYFLVNDTRELDMRVEYIDSDYTYDIHFTKVNFVGTRPADGKSFAVFVGERGGWVEMTGGDIRTRTGNTCSQEIDTDAVGYVPSFENNEATEVETEVFFETEMKVYKNDGNGGKRAVVTSDDVYMKITDIDAGQSFKILNTTNPFSKNNMFVESEEALEEDDADGPKNRFGNGYVYSDILNDNGVKALSSDQKANLYVKIDSDSLASEKGVQLVLGFTGGAGSLINFYSQMHEVLYISDENGEIVEDGITSEKIIHEDMPSGSSTTPAEGYKLSHWIANKDVELSTGEKISAGKPLTAEQVKQVVVKSDISFTAIHKKADVDEDGEEDEEDEDDDVIATPNTGAPTGEMNATILSISLVGVAVVALMLGLTPKLTHKKVSFKKR